MREVFQGRLRAGQHLATQQLAELFGVSHTPIREALVALAGIGVIDLVPNRGAIVRRVVAKDVREIFHVRRVLECEAVRSACGRIESELLRSLADALTVTQADQARRLNPSDDLQREAVEEARQLDSRLHDLITASCGNGFLAKEITRLKTLFRAFRDLAWEHTTSHNDFGRLAEETGEHLAIVEALLEENRRQAVRAMSYHIRSGGRYWSRVLPEEGVGGSAVRVRGSERGKRNSRVRVEENGK